LLTVIAGQNEAGKTAILMALRDFDLEEGVPPITPEYLPEYDATSTVRVQFQVNIDQVVEYLAEYRQQLPDAFIEHLRSEKKL
jgi:hypothetical protein